MLFSLLVTSSLSSFQRFLAIVLCILPIAVVCDNGCIFSGKFYPLGKVWHPQLETRGAPICATCKCHPGGKFNCTSKVCLPGTCLNPRNDPESCCASCQEVSLESSAETPSQQAFSCLHNGRIFRDGHSFTTNDSGLVPSTPNQCVQCICQSGAITCELKTCATLNCPVITRISSNCCPVCDGQPINCYSGQQSFQHGAVWHVPLVPTQTGGCEECKCQYGKIECAPLRCPRGRQLCSSIPLTCCPSCPMKSKPRKTSTKPPPIEKETFEGDASIMCLPTKTSVAVYKNQASTNNSGYLQYLFIHAEPKSRVELHSWTLKDGKISDLAYQQLTKENVQTLKNTFRFNLLGATHQKFLSKFLQRERQLKKKCARRCRKKIERLQKILRLKEISTRSRCLKGETIMR